MPEHSAEWLRRVDALVAEKVMGWHVKAVCKDDGGKYIGLLVRERLTHLPWSPCSSWDAAGQVVERMRELGWTMNLDVEAGALRNPYDCRFFHGDGERRAMQIEQSAPLAICLAALKAVGVDVPAE